MILRVQRSTGKTCYLNTSLQRPSQSESRSNTGNRQGEGKKGLLRNWRDLSPDSKALFQFRVCMHFGGSHGKKSCEHADSPKECEKCGRNNHTTAACFAKDGKEESGTSSRSRRREKNALNLRLCPETTHQAKSPKSPLKSN